MTSHESTATHLTDEDLARSSDRARVDKARRRGKRWRLMWLLAGPGVLAMLGENDGPSMISYATDGARYGLGAFLPFIIILFGMAFVCQEMCMRVGSVTHRGYGELVLQRFGRTWGWFGAGDLVLTNLITLVSEFVAIRIGLAYFHLGAPVAAILGLGLVLVTISGRRYWRWERVVLAFAAFNGLFLVAAIMVKPDPGSIGHAFTTSAPLPTGNGNTLLLLLTSTIGATVTPWMIFFQQSASVDKGMTSRDLTHGRLDTACGAALAAIFGCSALLAGAALAGRGGFSVQGFAGAGFPAALSGVSGNAVGTIFALGLIEAGGLAILTISASTAYAAGECVGVSHSFNSSPRRAALFHLANVGSATIAAAIILIPSAPLLQIALNSNVLATVLSPVALIFVVMLANDRLLMGEFVNTRLGNFLGIAIIAFVAACGAAYGTDAFLQAVHIIPASS